MYISNFSSFIPSPLKETNQKSVKKDASIRKLRNKHLSPKGEDKENTAPSFSQENTQNLKIWEREIAGWINKNRTLLDLPTKKNCGNKFTNLMKMEHLAAIFKSLGLEGVDIPVPQGIPAELLENFLKQAAPEIFSLWDDLKKEYGENPHINFLKDPQVIDQLKQIQTLIQEAFLRADDKLFPIELVQWLKSSQENGTYLMVRSTGNEDTKESSNAGGNLSEAYVLPEIKEVYSAISRVISSYFGTTSLQNQLDKNQNPFLGMPQMSVMLQELIGETIGGAQDPKEIPISLVLFTNEPLYIGDELFRVMRVSATAGHGESVVNSQGVALDTVLLLCSEKHPEKLYVVYDQQEKPVRLAPVSTSEGVKLQKVQNPKELKKGPVLTHDLIRRLYEWGVIGEAFFEGPTDMEIVIKNNTIYPVQARPVDRPKLLPTYFDVNKVPNERISFKREAETIVSGKSSVVEIDNKEDVIVVTRLEDAQKKFQQGKTKLILFSVPTGENSHPVVIFSGLGIPCLQVDNQESALKMINQIDPDHPLVACVQTGTLFHLHGKTENEWIVKGFTQHPARVSPSLRIEKKPPHSRKVSEAPKEIKNLLLQLRSAETRDVAEKVLEEIKQNPWVKQAKEAKQELESSVSQLPQVPSKVAKALSSLDQIDLTVKEAFKETKAVVQDKESGRLKRLFHGKVLEELLSKKGKAGSIGRYGMIDIAPIKEATKMLIDYQHAHPFPVRFSNLALLGYQAFTNETRDQWIQFLSSLETLVEEKKIDPTTIEAFQDLMGLLEKMHALPSWFAFSFAPLYSEEKSLTTLLEKLITAFPSEERPFIDSLLEKQEKIIEMERSLERFSQKETFDQAFDELKTLQKLFTEKDFVTQLENASSFTQRLTVNPTNRFISLFDQAIKSMKASGSLTDEEKVALFKNMLLSYFDLLKAWVSLIPEGKIPTHEIWPIDRYIYKIEEILKNMGTEDISLLLKSDYFSVNAALLGASTRFERHFPKTLEDLFTLIHQNLLVITAFLENSSCTPSIMEKSGLPPLLKEMVDTINPNYLGTNIQRTGISVNPDTVEITYNIPLRSHSGILVLTFDSSSQQYILTAKLVGPGIMRWDLFKEMSDVLSASNILPSAAPSVQEDKELIIYWQIQNCKSLQIALEEYGIMCNLSLGDDFEESLIHDLIKRRQVLTHADGFNKCLKMAEKRLMDPKVDIRLNGLDFFLFFLQENKAIDRVIEAAQSAIHDPDQYVIKKGFSLFKNLLEKGLCITEAMEALQKGFQIGTLTIEMVGLDFIRETFLKGTITEEAIHLVLKDIETPNNVHNRLINLLVCALEKDPSDMTANAIVSHQPLMTWLHSTLRDGNNSSTEAKELLFQLFTKPVALGLLIENAKKQIQDINPKTRQNGLDLLHLLIEKEQNIESALEVIQSTFNDTDLEVRKKSLSLIEILISKGKGVEEAIEICKKNIDNTQSVQLLFSLLLSNAISMETAISLLNNMTKKPEIQKTLLQKLISTLRNSQERQKIINDASFEKIAITCAQQGVQHTGVTNTDKMIKNYAFQLFSLLVSFKKGIKEAEEALEQNKNESDGYTRDAINYLKKNLSNINSN